MRPSRSPSAPNPLSNLLAPPPPPDAPIHMPYVADMTLSAGERKKIKDTYRKCAKRKDQRHEIQLHTGTTLKQVAVAKAGITKASPIIVTPIPHPRSNGWTGPRIAPQPTILSVPDVLRIAGLRLITSDPQ